MKKPLAFLCIAFCLVLLIPVRAPALTYNLDDAFSGDTPTGASPWLRVDISNISGGVRIDFVSQLKSAPEFIRSAYLNVNPVLNAANFSITNLTPATPATVQTGTNAFKADGDGYYDLLFKFQTSGGAGRFQAGETASFNVLYTGLTDSDFVFLSAPGGGAGPYYAASHIQGIPGEGEGSGWIAPTGPETPEPVPEPATLMLIGSGLIAGWWRSKKK